MTDTAERQAYYKRIDQQNLTPLWSVMSGLITPKPKSQTEAHIWHYEDVRPALMESAGLITAKQAERRVLILENPGLRGQSKITTSLYAGLQLVMPGEVAPAHRHSQSALRFVLEGSGAHTTVDGERAYMEPGDFVITPNWTWHDHGNTSDKPIVWLDGLDIPLVQFFDASFAESLGEDEQPVSRPSGDALARYGQGFLPVDYETTSKTSPVFCYPYERARAALESMRKAEQWDPCHGLKSRYVNPLTGDHAMPTMAAFLQLLPKDFTTQAYRSTDATIFVCIEGGGSSQIGNVSVSWKPRDIFVAPSWQQVSHSAKEDAVLFSYSDRAVQEKLGLWREDRGSNEIV